MKSHIFFDKFERVLGWNLKSDLAISGRTEDGWGDCLFYHVGGFCSFNVIHERGNVGVMSIGLNKLGTNFECGGRKRLPEDYEDGGQVIWFGTPDSWSDSYYEMVAEFFIDVCDRGQRYADDAKAEKERRIEQAKDMTWYKIASHALGEELLSVGDVSVRGDLHRHSGNFIGFKPKTRHINNFSVSVKDGSLMIFVVFLNGEIVDALLCRFGGKGMGVGWGVDISLGDPNLQGSVREVVSYLLGLV